MACQPPVSWSDPKDLGQVYGILKDRLYTAFMDCPHRGGLYCNSGKRTDYMQWLLRRGRVPAGQEYNRAYKGSPTTAIPGRSNHRNLSDDISACDVAGIDLNWLGEHEKEYGLHRPVPGEKWHFEPHGTPTRRILPYGQPHETATDPNKGREWKGISPGDTDGVNGSVYKRGGLNNEVHDLQLRLYILSKTTNKPKLDPHGIDGIYKRGGGTEAAVREFHRVTREYQLFINAVNKSKHDPSRVMVWPARIDGNVGVNKMNLLRFYTA